MYYSCQDLKGFAGRREKGNTMLLKEFIEKTDDKTLFYIGANSAFMFAGYKPEYEEEITEISDRYYDSAQKGLKADKNTLKRLLETDIWYNDEPVEIYVQKLKNHSERIEQTVNRISERTLYIQNFTDLWEREIKEKYSRITDNGIVVIIDGTENGQYWDKEEYDRANRKEEE